MHTNVKSHKSCYWIGTYNSDVYFILLYTFAIIVHLYYIYSLWLNLPPTAMIVLGKSIIYSM